LINNYWNNPKTVDAQEFSSSSLSIIQLSSRVLTLHYSPSIFLFFLLSFNLISFFFWLVLYRSFHNWSIYLSSCTRITSNCWIYFATSMRILYECEVAHLFDEQKKKVIEIFLFLYSRCHMYTCTWSRCEKEIKHRHIYTHNRVFFSSMHASCFMLACHWWVIYGNVRCYSLVKVCRFIFRNLFFL